MKDWKNEIDKLEITTNKSNSYKLELVNHQIGYIGWCIGMEKYEEAKKYLKLSSSHIKELKEKKFKPSYVKSYKGSIDGLKIGINNLYAILLGPGIISKAKSSIKLDNNNPYGYILLGNSKYYMWAMLGGSKDEAVHYYKIAEKIIENGQKTDHNWNYLSLLTMIAHANVEMGNYSEANLYYKKILQIEPNYKWIKEEIYPKFINKHGKK
jgi:tetratricopeptide (TPR) repeat protein